MDKHIVVLITAGSADEAKQLSLGLVEERLAFCVNTLAGIRSTYFWDGKMCEDEEVQLVVKSRADRFDALAAWVRENHSYDVPEVIALPIAQASADYLKCIDDWLGPPAPSR